MSLNEETHLPIPNELELAALPLTEFGNMERLLARYRDVLAFVPGVGWRCWSGRLWVNGDRGPYSPMVVAQNTIEAMRGELAALQACLLKKDPLTDDETALCYVNCREALWQWRAKSSRHSMLKNILELSKPHLTRRGSQWDRDPNRINLNNGTLSFYGLGNPEIRGDRGCLPELYPHLRDDYLTKIADVSYDPEATAPIWDAHLTRCLPDPDDRAYFQRCMGYCLTARCDEQVVFLLQGDGANGKSTTIRVLQDILGDYSASVNIEVFQKRAGRAPGAATPELIRLEGRRMVVASEPEDGACLSEARLKTFTGGDRVVSRGLYQEAHEYVPQFKLFIPCNTVPRIEGQSAAIWRRVQVLEWTTHLSQDERDPGMADKLATESTGIFNWMVRGLIDFSKQGLAPPKNVREAVSRYRGTASPMARWVEARLQTGLADENMLRLSDLHSDYESWCARQKTPPLDIRGFGQALAERGIPAGRRGGQAMRRGVAFKGRPDQSSP